MAAPVTFDVQYTEQRSRLTNAFRLILAIPHLIIVGALGYAANIVAVIQWFAILFTGKRIRGLWNFSYGVLNWQTRVSAYAGLLYDPYPNFGFERGDEPVTFGFAYEEEANRLTCALRIIWAIPAIFIAIFVAIAAWVLTAISWFAILFTGSHPKGMWDFMLRFQRFAARLGAYVALLTDTYPKFE